MFYLLTHFLIYLLKTSPTREAFTGALEQFYTMPVQVASMNYTHLSGK